MDVTSVEGLVVETEVPAVDGPGGRADASCSNQPQRGLVRARTRNGVGKGAVGGWQVPSPQDRCPHGRRGVGG